MPSLSTAGGVARRQTVRFRVPGDVSVELFKIIESLIVPPQLGEGRQRGVGGAGTLRVGNLISPLYSGLVRFFQHFGTGRFFSLRLRRSRECQRTPPRSSLPASPDRGTAPGPA